MARFRDSMIELVGAIMMMAVTARCLMSGGVGMVLCLVLVVRSFFFLKANSVHQPLYKPNHSLLDV